MRYIAIILIFLAIYIPIKHQMNNYIRAEKERRIAIELCKNSPRFMSCPRCNYCREEVSLEKGYCPRCAFKTKEGS